MEASKSHILHGFGALAKRHRAALLISQDELADRAGLDRTYVSGLERGVRNPSLTALVSLASGLGLTVSELLKELECEAQAFEE